MAKTTYKETINQYGSGVFKIGTINKKDLEEITTTTASKRIIEQIPNDYNIRLNFESVLWFKVWKKIGNNTKATYYNFIGNDGIPRHNDDYKIILNFVKSNCEK